MLGLTHGKNETVNVATAKEVSDQSVFEAIAQAFDFKEEPCYTPTRSGEVMRISMSYAKAKKILGWMPKVAFEDGIKRMMSHP